jgi:hypothetical protein
MKTDCSLGDRRAGNPFGNFTGGSVTTPLTAALNRQQ